MNIFSPRDCQHFAANSCFQLVAVLGLMGFCAGQAQVSAQSPVYINEIFFNPGGNGSDSRDEYIEIRGEPNAPLTDHYLIILESENNGQTGAIENIFDLGNFSLGSNGFLVLRQAYSLYGNPSPINPLATDLVNTGPPLPGPAYPGYGDGANSTIGASDLPSSGTGPGEGQLEGSGFTAMMIHNISGDAPMLGQDLDDGDDGLDIPTGAEGWEILDSIGFITELEELDGRVYGQVNFFTVDEFVTDEELEAIVEPGSQIGKVGYEIEYLGRWGNSTGSTPDDWHASNFTDNPGSGSFGVNDLAGTANDSIDWRQSRVGDHPADDGDPTTPAPQPPELESNKGVPYGTRLAASIGGPNYITGDFNQDGYVNLADYVVWRDSVGVQGTEFDHPAADHNHDFRVDELDYALWKANLGAPFNTTPLNVPGSLATNVPEPQSMLLLLGGLLGLWVCKRPYVLNPRPTSR